MSGPRKRNSPQRTQAKVRPAARAASSRQAAGAAPELIDPRWLLKALGIVLGVALLLAWGTLCLLWYQGQWQLVLHPSRTVVSPSPAEIRFADDATGTPRLSGWWIPADDSAGAQTALMLHGADGSIADALPQALTLHKAGLNVLLFDYRGYGRSTGQHPTQDSMQTDAAAALNYLIGTQHIAPQSIVVYGTGVGASLAVQLAAQHREIPAVILNAPEGDLTARILRDAHSWLIPVRLLFHEDFPLAAPLRTLPTPKLLITYGNSAPIALAGAADPKMTLELPSPNDPALTPGIDRFLSLYMHSAQQP